MDAAHADLGVAASCLLAFRDMDGSDREEAGAVLLAEGLLIMRQFRDAYRKK